MHLRNICVPACSIWEVASPLTFSIGWCSLEGGRRTSLTEIHGSSERLQVCVVWEEVATVVHGDVRVTARTVHPIHSDIRHDGMRVACDIVTRCSSKLGVPCYLGTCCSSTYLH